MSLSVAVPARARVCRRSMSGAELVAVAHDRWTEYFLNLAPVAGESPFAIFGRLAYLLHDNEITVLKQTVLGSRTVRDQAMVALHASCPRMDWPVSWIEGADCDGRPLAGIQVHGLGGVEVETLWCGDRPVGKTFAADAARYAIVGDIQPSDASAPRPEQAYECYCALEGALQSAGLAFSDVVRTWLFIDNILGWYSGLNAARNRFFSERRVSDGLVPASTGIGVSNLYDKAMIVDALAIRSDSGAMPARSLASPLQGPAPAYGSVFSRAVESEIGGCRRVLISGTASIAPDGATAHVGDTERQVELTLRVVDALLDSRDMSLEDISRAIAYFRKPADAPILARCLAERGLRSLPVVVVQADICRDDLLFEIEVDAIA